MAKIKKGITGGFRGPIANIVGSSNGSKEVIRKSKSGLKVGNRVSGGQQCSNFRVASGLFKMIKPSVLDFLSRNGLELDFVRSKFLKYSLGFPFFYDTHTSYGLGVKIPESSFGVDAFSTFSDGADLLRVYFRDFQTLKNVYPDIKVSFARYTDGVYVNGNDSANTNFQVWSRTTPLASSFNEYILIIAYMYSSDPLNPVTDIVMAIGYNELP